MATGKRQPVYEINTDVVPQGETSDRPTEKVGPVRWVRVINGDYFVHPVSNVRIDTRGRPLADGEQTGWLRSMINRGLLETYFVSEPGGV